MDTIIFVTATVVAILASLYLFAQSQVAFLKKHWTEYRCNPMYMPVAGLVGDSVVSNFTKCTMKGFQDYAGFIMDPIMGEFSVITDTIGEIGGAMSSFRSMFSSVRGGFLGIIGSVFGKIHNVMAQTQYIVIRMRTILARIVGVMYSFVYIFYSGMQTGESVVNGPVGKTMSFLCFDENTKVDTFNGLKSMKDIMIGDRLTNNLAIVTSTYKLDGTGIQMYDLSGVIVTGSHKVKHNKKYIRVDNHPRAKRVIKESKNLVCLNTNTHKISIRNYEFLDFIESDNHFFEDFKNRYVEMLYNGKIMPMATGRLAGLLDGTIVSMKNNQQKQIQNIIVGDILDNGDIVKGICKHFIIDSKCVEIDAGVLSTLSTLVYINDSVISAEKYGHIQMHNRDGYFYAYQLITETSMYPVLTKNNKRIMILDELKTTEPFYHKMKDSIITSGRFRSKVIVI